MLETTKVAGIIVVCSVVGIAIGVGIIALLMRWFFPRRPLTGRWAPPGADCAEAIQPSEGQGNAPGPHDDGSWAGFRGVVQPGRTRALGARSRRFKSGRPDRETLLKMHIAGTRHG